MLCGEYVVTFLDSICLEQNTTQQVEATDNLGFISAWKLLTFIIFVLCLPEKNYGKTMNTHSSDT